MLRILLLVIVGLFGAMAALRAIAAGILLIGDLRKEGAHAPEMLGLLVGSIVIALLCGWLWRKLYSNRNPGSGGGPKS